MNLNLYKSLLQYDHWDIRYRNTEWVETSDKLKYEQRVYVVTPKKNHIQRICGKEKHKSVSFGKKITENVQRLYGISNQIR